MGFQSTSFPPQPLVPVYIDRRSQTESNAQKPKNELTFNQKVESILNEDCGLCLEPLGLSVESNGRKYRVLVKTECDHFFHENCYKEATAGKYVDNCMYCRSKVVHLTSVDLDTLKTHVYLANPAKAPVEEPAKPVVEEPAAKPAEQEAKAEAKPNFINKFLSGTWGIVSNAIWSNAADEEAKKITVVKVSGLVAEWEEMISNIDQTFKLSNKNMLTLLAKVVSLPGSKSNAAQSVIERIEKNMKVFEEKIKDSNIEFSKYLDEEIKNI